MMYNNSDYESDNDFHEVESAELQFQMEDVDTREYSNSISDKKSDLSELHNDIDDEESLLPNENINELVFAAESYEYSEYSAISDEEVEENRIKLANSVDSKKKPYIAEVTEAACNDSSGLADDISLLADDISLIPKSGDGYNNELNNNEVHLGDVFQRNYFPNSQQEKKMMYLLDYINEDQDINNEKSVNEENSQSKPFVERIGIKSFLSISI